MVQYLFGYCSVFTLAQLLSSLLLRVALQKHQLLESVVSETASLGETPSQRCRKAFQLELRMQGCKERRGLTCCVFIFIHFPETEGICVFCHEWARQVVIDIRLGASGATGTGRIFSSGNHHSEEPTTLPGGRWFIFVYVSCHLPSHCGLFPLPS